MQFTLSMCGFAKNQEKPVKLPEAVTLKLAMVKYVVLAVIVFLCFKGVYSQTQGYSPWDVFSMLHAFNFKLGGYLLGIVLLLLIMIGMAVQERFFCRLFVSDGGQSFSLLPILSFFTLKREREQCIKGCSACTKQCPSDIGLPEAGTLDISGDCFQCQKCIDTCPRANIHCGTAGHQRQ